MANCFLCTFFYSLFRDNPVDECDLDLYFIGTYDLLGALREDELIEGGKDIKVTEENKSDYIRYTNLLPTKRLRMSTKLCIESSGLFF